MSRLIIVSNRVVDLDNQLQSGALAVALGDALRSIGGIWFGWDGNIVEEGTPIEVCMTVAWPEAARALLMYRFHTLPGARAKAAYVGCRGALYAWESADTGMETTPESVVAPDGKVVDILTGKMECHINADIAYAVWHYWRFTRQGHGDLHRRGNAQSDRGNSARGSDLGELRGPTSNRPVVQGARQTTSQGGDNGKSLAFAPLMRSRQSATGSSSTRNTSPVTVTICLRSPAGIGGREARSVGVRSTGADNV